MWTLKTLKTELIKRLSFTSFLELDLLTQGLRLTHVMDSSDIKATRSLIDCSSLILQTKYLRPKLPTVTEQDPWPGSQKQMPGLLPLCSLARSSSVNLSKQVVQCAGEDHLLGECNGTPPVLLPGKSQGQGSLVGCRLWGRKESDTTEAT